jgi:hypothetical protein
MRQDYCHNRNHRGRETDMLILLLTAVGIALVLAYAVSAVRRVIQEDGARDPHRNPPRSHYTDPFDPRSRLA